MLVRTKFHANVDNVGNFIRRNGAMSELLPQCPAMLGAIERGKGEIVKWQALLAGALASAVATVVASSMALAEVRIVSDPGGEVASYITKYRQIRDTGQRVVIDGPCLSACTLVVGIVPHDHICITHRAMLGFHAASYYDDASQSLVPTRAGSRLVMRFYPTAVRSWIQHHGGLTPRLIQLRGRELAALYNTCE
jgi:hypothetical protein